ncbi:hypothetical protein M7I_0514 [Glarea lozoyensis 74030]|uniref:Uncharacterized protein n=1 Tax=Glarea lozoyensis (strain ATCC 74030 / MF5533) TaxID=1104152 RepID=H0EDQ9_GLAL7|nr:hypothetical protein M7I_0514 [Glarea lozoyensis 74030]
MRQLHHSGVDLGEIQYVVNDVKETVSARLDGVRIISLFVSERCVLEEVNHARNSNKRGSNFVRHIAKKPGLNVHILLEDTLNRGLCRHVGNGGGFGRL